MSRSVISPDFIYTPSKNIYWKKLTELAPGMQGLAFCDHATEAHRGKWRQQFKLTGSDQTPLHVEIGCNAGHVVLEWAKQNPNIRYIGIDWKFKQIHRLAEKIQKNSLGNILAFRANADRLPFMFAPEEISVLHMFFPDPWPKKAHQKNRTASEAWLRSIAPLIHSDGHFHLKTDHREYFDFIIDNIKRTSDIFEVTELSYDLHKAHPNPLSLKIPEVTLFERLFIKDGLPIHSVKIKKKP